MDRLIGRGHGPGAWDYPISRFLRALNNAAEADREDMIRQATAVRMGCFADKKTWQQFTAQPGRHRQALPASALAKKMGKGT